MPERPVLNQLATPTNEAVTVVAGDCRSKGETPTALRTEAGLCHLGQLPVEMPAASFACDHIPLCPVELGVLAPRDDLQILRPIIGSHAVLMVDMFGRQKLPADDFGHDEPMDLDHLSVP